MVSELRRWFSFGYSWATLGGGSGGRREGSERTEEGEAEEGQRSRAAMGQLEPNESQRRVSLRPCKVPQIYDEEGLREKEHGEGEASTGLILVVQGSLVTVNQWGGGGLQPMSRRLTSLTSSKTPRSSWHLCGHFPRFLTSGWWNGGRGCPIKPLSLYLQTKSQAYSVKWIYRKRRKRRKHKA